MKRALLWLGPLACLALACLYAYAWFTRDPLVTAFERIEIDMTVDDARTIVGRKRDSFDLIILGGCCLGSETWQSDRYNLTIDWVGRKVTAKNLKYRNGTLLAKIRSWIRDPASLWRPDEFGVDIGLQAPTSCNRIK